MPGATSSRQTAERTSHEAKPPAGGNTARSKCGLSLAIAAVEGLGLAARRREDPVIVALRDWGHLKVDGPDHLRFLQGMCTIDVEKLAVGGHAWGDLLARVIVEVPTRLDGEQRAKLEEFASLCGDENTPMRKSFFERAKEFFK